MSGLNYVIQPVPLSISLNWELTRFDDNTDTEVLMLAIPRGQISSGGFFLNYNNAADDCQLAVDPDLVTTTVSLANTKLQIKLYDGDFQTSTLIDTADDMVVVPAAGDNPVGGLNRNQWYAMIYRGTEHWMPTGIRRINHLVGIQGLRNLERPATPDGKRIVLWGKLKRD